MQDMALQDRAKGGVRRPSLQLAGRYDAKLVRNGVVVGEYSIPNAIVDVGINHILETAFNGGTPIAAWYTGLVDNSGFTAYANADTMASHAGWTELTSYSEAARPEWTAGTASARQITNATTVDFTMSAAGTVKGLFITSDTTKADTTGTLWSTASFTSAIAVSIGDVLMVTYTVTG